MHTFDSGTHKLNAHLFKVRDTVSSTPPKLAEIKAALVELLVHLSLPEGRTNENCITTDTFFRLHDDYGFNWFHLPEEFQLILQDMGSQLHDTMEHPDIATNYECTPEQLLERIHSLPC